MLFRFYDQINIYLFSIMLHFCWFLTAKKERTVSYVKLKADCQSVTQIMHFPFFLLFLHTSEKGRKTRQNASNLPTWHVMIRNATRYVCKHNTLRLKFTLSFFEDFSSQKVCKNVQKVPVLLSVDANSINGYWL